MGRGKVMVNVGLESPELPSREFFPGQRRDTKRKEKKISCRKEKGGVSVYDNSEECDPLSAQTPKPKLILHAVKGQRGKREKPILEDQ